MIVKVSFRLWNGPGLGMQPSAYVEPRYHYLTAEYMGGALNIRGWRPPHACTVNFFPIFKLLQFSHEYTVYVLRSWAYDQCGTLSH